MAIGFLVAGTTVIRKKERCKLIRQFKDRTWQMEHLDSGRVIEASEDELHMELANDELIIVISDDFNERQRNNKPLPKSNLWNSLSDAHKNQAKRKFSYVKGALTLPKTYCVLEQHIQEVAKQSKDATPPCAASLRTWLRRYEKGGRDIVSLVAKTRNSGNRTPRIDTDIVEIIDSSLDEVYLAPNRNSMADARLHAIAIINQKNKLLNELDQFSCPKISYFYERLKRRNKFDICAARFGQQHAVRRFRNVVGFSHGERPLARVEIDHTPINAIVIDDETILPLGRPYLTAALDDNTRNVLGLCLTFDPPSYRSVARCLMHAILPKSYVSTRYPKIMNRWECHGIPDTLVVDNGPEFHSKALEEAALRFGIELQYCPRAQPWYKGKIERFLGTVNRQLVHTLPGTTFSNIVDKSDYDSTKTAVISLRALEELIHTWCIDFYHQKRHTTLNDTPANVWRERTAGMPIPLPTYSLDLEAALAVPEKRVLSHKGIEIFSMFYNSEECRFYRAKFGLDQKIYVRYSPQNIGYIFVEFETDHPIKVPVIEKYRSYATDLSKWQHEIIHRYALNHNGQDNIESLIHAKKRIAEITAEQLYNRKRTTRKSAARQKHSETQSDTSFLEESIAAFSHDKDESSYQTPADELEDEFRAAMHFVQREKK
jgi:putative transposase